MQSPHGKTVRFAIAAALLVGALYAVSGLRKVPRVPGDAVHAGTTSNQECSPCHGANAPNPLSSEHPPKEDCLHCHGSGT